MVAASETLVRRLRAGLVLPLLALLVMPVERCVTWSNVKGPFKNNFRFWRERRRARCEARGGSIPHSGAVPTSKEADGPTPPRPSGLGLFGLLASLLTPHRPLRVCSSLAPRQQAK